MIQHWFCNFSGGRSKLDLYKPFKRQLQLSPFHLSSPATPSRKPMMPMRPNGSTVYNYLVCSTDNCGILTPQISSAIKSSALASVSELSLPRSSGGSPVATTHWAQSYNPTGFWPLSTLLAAFPLLVLLTLIAGFRVKAHLSALAGLGVALIIALHVFHMLGHLAFLATASLRCLRNVPHLLDRLSRHLHVPATVRAWQVCPPAAMPGRCHRRQPPPTPPHRLRSLEPSSKEPPASAPLVAVCGTILTGLGFVPLEAAGLALLANTAPVAFGALGTPLIALHGVTGIDTFVLSNVVATLLTPFCILVPFWLISAFMGFTAMIEIWPAVLVTGVTFGVTQLMVARYEGPWLVDIFAVAKPASPFWSYSCASGSPNASTTQNARTSPTSLAPSIPAAPAPSSAPACPGSSSPFALHLGNPRR